MRHRKTYRLAASTITAIDRYAREAGMTPGQYIDEIVPLVRSIWRPKLLPKDHPSPQLAGWSKGRVQ